MKNHTENILITNELPVVQPIKTTPSFDGYNLQEVLLHLESEVELNADILRITMRIKDRYPELSKYIEEMPVTIPNETHPEITLQNLRAYYDSLNSLLSKYVLEHPNKIK